MTLFTVTYSNNYFNVICDDLIEALNEEEAIKKFENEYKNLSYIEFIEIKEVKE